MGKMYAHCDRCSTVSKLILATPYVLFAKYPHYLQRTYLDGSQYKTVYHQNYMYAVAVDYDYRSHTHSNLN